MGLALRLDGREAELKSYGAFQQEGKMQRAVARQLVRQCSTRNYEGALLDCLEGYGIKQRQASWRLKAAWAENDPSKAEAELRKVVKWLETISPGAARSLEEGLAETLTLNRLGLHEDLIKTFASTNLIESCFRPHRGTDARGLVKRWQGGEMFLRWTGAALLFAEKGFRKVRGYRHLHQLTASLKNQSFDGGQIAA